MARQVNASNNYKIASGFEACTVPFSFSAWIYFPTITNGAQFSSIFADTGPTTGGLQLDQGQLAASGWGLNKQNVGGVRANTIFVAANWYNIAGSVDTSSTPNVNLYTNGSLDKTGTLASTLTTGLGPYFITSGDSSNQADWAFWNVLLTAAEFKSLGQGVRPYRIRPNNLRLWLPLDGIQTTEPDFSGNSYNATISVGTPALAAGPPIAPFTSRWPLTTPSQASPIPIGFTGFPNVTRPIQVITA